MDNKTSATKWVNNGTDGGKSVLISVNIEHGIGNVTLFDEANQEIAALGEVDELVRNLRLLKSSAARLGRT